MIMTSKVQYGMTTVLFLLRRKGRILMCDTNLDVLS